MTTVTIQTAKRHLSHLIDRAAAGEDIILTRAGKPVARLVPWTESPARPRRVLGILAGQVRVSEDFDAPLPDDILDAFEGR